MKLDIPSDISFDTDKSQIKSQMRPLLDKFAYGLKDSSAATVRIIGYTDSPGTDAMNNPLSVNRAAKQLQPAEESLFPRHAIFSSMLPVASQLRIRL